MRTDSSYNWISLYIKSRLFVPPSAQLPLRTPPERDVHQERRQLMRIISKSHLMPRLYTNVFTTPLHYMQNKNTSFIDLIMSLNNAFERRMVVIWFLIIKYPLSNRFLKGYWQNYPFTKVLTHYYGYVGFFSLLLDDHRHLIQVYDIV
mgnify:CR=1 FL=1